MYSPPSQLTFSNVLLEDFFLGELEETYDEKEMERIELGLSEFSELFGL